MSAILPTSAGPPTSSALRQISMLQVTGLPTEPNSSSLPWSACRAGAQSRVCGATQRVPVFHLDGTGASSRQARPRMSQPGELNSPACLLPKLVEVLFQVGLALGEQLSVVVCSWDGWEGRHP